MSSKNNNPVREEPAIARLMFGDTRFGWLWLPLRLYLGWVWWEAGWHKFMDPKWIGIGDALLEFWNRGLKMTPKPVIAVDWYRSFIEFLANSGSHTWFAKLIIFGELAIALGLILGALSYLQRGTPSLDVEESFRMAWLTCSRTRRMCCFSKYRVASFRLRETCRHPLARAYAS